jgi:hypothetical protein
MSLHGISPRKKLDWFSPKSPTGGSEAKISNDPGVARSISLDETPK